MPRRNQAKLRIVAAPRVLRAWKPTPEECAGDVTDLGEFRNPPKKERRKRTDRERENDPLESHIQKTIVVGLRQMLADGYRVKANVECIDPIERGHAISKGWELFWPDVEVWGFGAVFLIEVKRRKKYATEDQIKRHNELRSMGFIVLSECRSLDEAVAHLVAHKVRFKARISA